MAEEINIINHEELTLVAGLSRSGMGKILTQEGIRYSIMEITKSKYFEDCYLRAGLTFSRMNNLFGFPSNFYGSNNFYYSYYKMEPNFDGTQLGSQFKNCYQGLLVARVQITNREDN